MTVRPEVVGVLEPALHLGEPIAVIDGGEQAPVPSQEGLVLELEVLGQRHQDLLRDRPARGSSQSGDIRLDGDRPGRWPDRPGAGRRPAPRPYRRRRAPRAGVPATTMPAPRTKTAATISADPQGARGATPAPASPPSSEPVANRRRSSAADRGSGRSRSSSGRAAQTTTSPARSPTLVPNSFGLRRHQERARDRHEQAEDDPPDAPGRHGLGVGDHEEQEDQHLGRRDDRPARSRRRRPARTPSSWSCSGPTRPGRRPRRTSVTQKVAARASRCSRRVISSPPTMITA